MLEGVEKLYSTLITRDVTYVFAGGVPLGYLLYALQFENLFQDWPGIATVTFLAFSYFLGFALFHAAMVLPCRRYRIVRMFPADGGSSERQAVWSHYVFSHLNETQSLYANRIVFLKHTDAVITIVAVVLFILVAVYPADRPLFREYSLSRWQWFLRVWPWLIVLAALALSCGCHNRRHARIQRRLLDRWARDLRIDWDGSEEAHRASPDQPARPPGAICAVP